jgi:type I restriction enzyme S subunit
MSSEWKNLLVSELADQGKRSTASGPFGSNLVSRDYTESGVPVIRGGNMSNGRWVGGDFAWVSEDKAEELSANLAFPGEIVFTQRGTLGQVCLVPDGPYNKYVLSQSQMKLRVNLSICDPLFMLYQFASPGQQAYIDMNAIRVGVPHTNLGILRDTPCQVPPLSTQKAIAHILGTLDDKIELNRKTNETLEAMAKALFKSWFVDFDPVRAKAEGRPTGLPAEISDLFPDSFEDSELGEIPRGWQCCSFTKLVDVISGGTPKTSIDEYWNGSIPWFSVVDAPPGSSCWVIQTEKRITPEGLANCSSKLLPTGTTIISARGTVGKVCLAGRDMAMNQSCYGLRSKAENGEFFCFYLTNSLVEILEARAHGSVFSTITRDTLDGVATISPSLEAIQSFNRSTGALLGKIKTNLEENRILGNQRDTLLPKLISGELRIPDAEKMLEEVGI